jgi:hypothetical protein
MGTAASHTEEIVEINHSNYIVLYVMENHLYRKYFVLPRKSQIYGRIQSEKFTVAVDVPHILEEARDGSLIAFFNNDLHNIDLVAEAQDGGELAPYQAVSFFENITQQQYCAVDVTHLKMDRDTEILSTVCTTSSCTSPHSSVINRVDDWNDNISPSILKLKLAII